MLPEVALRTWTGKKKEGIQTPENLLPEFTQMQRSRSINGTDSSLGIRFGDPVVKQGARKRGFLRSLFRLGVRR